MWRNIARWLPDTNNVAPNSSSRVLRQHHSLSSHREAHHRPPPPFSPVPKTNSRLPPCWIRGRYRDSWAPLCWVSAQLQLQSLSSKSRCTLKQSQRSILISRVHSQKPFCLTEGSKVHKELFVVVPSRNFGTRFWCSAACTISPQKACEIQACRLDSRLRLHSAALALPYEQDPLPETTLLHMQLSPSQPPITKVHGTLNTVLWGIPMIANQITSKPSEGHIMTDDLMQTFKAHESCRRSLELTQLLQNHFAHLVPSSSPELVEAPGTSSVLPCTYSPGFVECPEDSNEEAWMSNEISKETQSTKTKNKLENSNEDAWMSDEISKETRSIKTKNKLEDTRAKYSKLRRRQIKVESEAWQCAADDYKRQIAQMCKNQLAPSLPAMKSLFLSWFEPLTNAIRAEQEAYRNGVQAKARSCYGPYLELLPAEKLAVITMHKTIAKLLADDGLQGLKISIPVLSIGEAVENEAKLQEIMKKKRRKHSEEKSGIEGEASKEQIEEHKALQKQMKTLMKQNKMDLLKKKIRAFDSSEPWTKTLHAHIGCRLLELLIETAYIQVPGNQRSFGSIEVRPAFRHILKTVQCANKGKNSRMFGVIQCDSVISSSLHKMARVVTPYMPMLVEPLPWRGYTKGGHLVLPNSIMRTHGARDLKEALKKAPNSQLKAVYEALNTLGSTRWRINNSVLEIVEKIWEEGGRIANLVDRADVAEPQKPESDDEGIQKRFRRELLKVRRVNRELHSQRCDIELKLSVARQMKSEECFYYPHNIDFRGRAYPMHPHLNHLGSDMCRGVLHFAEGRPLKSKGYWWLKVHLANLYGNGVDKLSFDDRVAFVDENMENILDSARRPLKGSRWWLKAEDPFQSLATCMEISDALASTNVEEFISHLPVHMDGSCNGLQHYAALGRDIVGAESVNLTDGEKPADVYTDIAIRVKRSLEKDFLDETVKATARILHSQVDRKLVKQTVMTSVYGVTYVGARDQILSRLQERKCLGDEKQAFTVSCYAAKKILAALGEMFESARIIMGWLGDCAKIIAVQNQLVRWKTPLGLPVVQPYRRLKIVAVRTSLQSLAISTDDETRVMLQRQKTAFPPNFVHSLDSTHMMMTASACKKAGLTFAGVHDSYWTHAGDIDMMNAILRQKFVELYNQPILENLLKDFQETFPDIQFPRIPTRGDFELREVLKAGYFFN